MTIGEIRIDYLSHVCFIFTSPSGIRVITDPFFAEGFQWTRGWERCLTPPDVPVESIRKCDVVFISHIHGDHYDPAAVEAIHRQTGADILAPADVCDDLSARGIAASHLKMASEGAAFNYGDFQLQTHGGYDNSFDGQKRPNKFSLHLATCATRLFYSGDCHDPPPSMNGRRVEAVFAWVHPSDAKLAAFLKAIPCARYVLMHGDRFEPGNFYCNMDMEKEKQRVLRFAPHVEAIIPERVHAIA